MAWIVENASAPCVCPAIGQDTAVILAPCWPRGVIRMGGPDIPHSGDAAFLSGTQT
jgi:hypothetical protein